MDSDTFPLTQQFLSQMLGVQRTTVSGAARVLEATGAITYRHGVIAVHDRAGLEAEACECYAVIRAEYARLLEDRAVPSVLGDVRTADGDETALSGGEPTQDSNRVDG
jgi:hypothetical protein